MFPQAADCKGDMTTRILYVRHGEVPGNDPSPSSYIYTGCRTNESLTEKGKIQAENCAQEIFRLQQEGIIGKVAGIYASHLKRADETSQPIAKVLGLDVHLSAALEEINWGSADGRLVEEMTQQWGEREKQVKALYPDRKIRWDHLPVFEGAESFNALLERNLAELQKISKTHPGETVIVVGHGRVLKTLIAEAMDCEKSMPYPKNCGIAEFTFSSEAGLKFIQIF